MRRAKHDRRSFLCQTLAAGFVASTTSANEPDETTVAAVQMGSHIGDMDGNLEEAENWIRHAIKEVLDGWFCPSFLCRE